MTDLGRAGANDRSTNSFSEIFTYCMNAWCLNWQFWPNPHILWTAIFMRFLLLDVTNHCFPQLRQSIPWYVNAHKKLKYLVESYTIRNQMSTIANQFQLVFGGRYQELSAKVWKITPDCNANKSNTFDTFNPCEIRLFLIGNKLLVYATYRPLIRCGSL